MPSPARTEGDPAALLAKVKVDRSHPQLGKQSLNRSTTHPQLSGVDHTPCKERCEFTLEPPSGLSGRGPEMLRFARDRSGFAKEGRRGSRNPVSGKGLQALDVRLGGRFMYPVAGSRPRSPVVRAILRR